MPPTPARGSLRRQHHPGALSAAMADPLKVMAASDWASLPSDLVRRVADVFLAASDVDYYMSLRAVCRHWRAATADPCRPDPRGWILLASLAAGDDHSCRCCLFLQVETGRFLWKEMPMLCNSNYTCVASTEDGHLVLEPASNMSRISLLNPITGHLVRFPVTGAQFLFGKEHRRRLGSTLFGAGTSTSEMVLYSRFDSEYGGCIDPTWDNASFNRESLFRAQPDLGTFAAIVPFKGRAYVLYKNGSVAVVEHNCRLDKEPVLTTIVDVTNEANWMHHHHRRVFLVDNAGELLLVGCMGPRSLVVFRVDVESGALEQVKSLGNRAVFLGEQRCISVDACNLPAIERNSLYYVGCSTGGGISVHRLDDGTSMELFESSCRLGYDKELGKQSPKSLARLLMEYTRYRIML